MSPAAGALLLEVRGALGQDVRVGIGAYFLGPALRREPGQIGRGRRRAIPLHLPLPLRRQLRHLSVADRHDDRPAHGEQARDQQGQPGPDGRALGATRGQIRIQFLAEAILLSLAGGVAGVIAGAVATAAHARGHGELVVIPPQAWAGGLAAAVIIGALAGLLPAIRAARLSPTRALLIV
jgi:hypothetical protein